MLFARTLWSDSLCELCSWPVSCTRRIRPNGIAVMRWAIASTASTVSEGRTHTVVVLSSPLRKIWKGGSGCGAMREIDNVGGFTSSGCRNSCGPCGGEILPERSSDEGRLASFRFERSSSISFFARARWSSCRSLGDRASSRASPGSFFVRASAAGLALCCAGRALLLLAGAGGASCVALAPAGGA